jgi:carbon-monoxide dehydrogenase small subunit
VERAGAVTLPDPVPEPGPADPAPGSADPDPVPGPTDPARGPADPAPGLGRGTGPAPDRGTAPGPADPYELVVNGVTRRVDGALVTESLLRVLRDRLGLPGSKNACEQGECGSCSVLVDGVLVCACLELAAAAAGCEVTTVEGVVAAGGRADAEPSDALLTDVQRAMVDAGGVQCGFCTPGFVVAVHDLLARVPAPAPLQVREALAGNLCRCTGYGRILAAVETVVALRADRHDALGPAAPAPADRGPARLPNGRQSPHPGPGTAP